MSATTANVKSVENGPWYQLDGTPAYEQPKKDGSGMTKTTLAHARKLNLVPSVTTILKVLDKPALTAWKIEQAVLAVMTSPRQAGEPDDAFIKRVLAVDKEQDAERDAAVQLGTDIHAAIELAINGQIANVQENLLPYIEPVLAALPQFGKPVASEICLVGNGYAGRTDLIAQNDEVMTYTVVDFKTTKRIPKDAYPEQRLQLAAYAKAHKMPASYRPRTANIYISTTEPGQIAVCVNEDVDETFEAFTHLVKVWQFLNTYAPKQ